MTLPRLISFSGYATAGKDAAADQFVKNDGYVKTYMSKPLEKALLTLDPWIKWAGNTERYSRLHDRVGYDRSKENPEVRRLLQKLGTEVGREMFDPDVWIDLVFEEISYLMLDTPVVLTGVRYPNELHAVHSRGGIAVWVDRPGVGPVNTHSSDNSIGPEDCDFVVPNAGSLSELYANTLYSLKAFEAAREARRNQPIGRVISMTENGQGLDVAIELTHCVYDTVLGNYMCLVHNEIVKKAGENFDPVRVACSHDKNRPKG